FEPHFTRKEFGKGTGLGLTIVHSIVSEHGGWMEVDSEIGAGTQFHAYFPRSRHGELQRQAPQEPVALNGRSLEGRETILLVDDEEMGRLVVRPSLGHRGYTVMEAANGEEAMKKFTEAPRRFDLVLLDLNLPKVGGGGVLRRLRQTEPAIAVI